MPSDHDTYENRTCGCGEGPMTYGTWVEHQDEVSDVSTQDEHAQPMLLPNDRPSIQDLVRADLNKREQIGIQRYGTKLQAHNGRDMLRDAYEEAMDLTVYLRGVIAERDEPKPVVDRDLQDRVRKAITAWHTNPVDATILTNAVMAVAAPVLAAKDIELEHLRAIVDYQQHCARTVEVTQLPDSMKVRFDIWHAMNRIHCGEVSEEWLDEWAKAVNEEVVQPELKRLHAELKLIAGFRQQYMEERDKAIAEREKAGELLARLSTAFGFLGEVLGVSADDIDHYAMVNQVAELQRARDQLRAELATWKGAYQGKVDDFARETLRVSAMLSRCDPKNVPLHVVGEAGLGWEDAQRHIKAGLAEADAQWAAQRADTEATERAPRCGESIGDERPDPTPVIDLEASDHGVPQEPDTPATPTEPRVWRKGDKPPPFDVKKVRHDNSQVFTQINPDRWQAGDWGLPITGEQLTARLGQYKLTEVSVDQAGGEA